MKGESKNYGVGVGSWLKVADTAIQILALVVNVKTHTYIFNVGHWWKTGKLNVWLLDVQDGGTRVIKKDCCLLWPHPETNIFSLSCPWRSLKHFGLNQY